MSVPLVLTLRSDIVYQALSDSNGWYQAIIAIASLVVIFSFLLNKINEGEMIKQVYFEEKDQYL